MPCYSPLTGYYGKSLNPSGKRSIVFNKREAYAGARRAVAGEVKLPCGQCIGCRLEKSRQWAMRCVHESQMHDENSFLTLTYDDKHLPHDLSLNLKHFQDFMKRLRKHVTTIDEKEGNKPRKLRFYHCGEYGDKFGRPHYHVCLFGFNFTDRVPYKEINGTQVYTSEILEEKWGHGFCTIGDLTFESAAYTARYCTKKVNGKKKKEHYTKVHPITGEILELKPEYTTMSRRPGIGKEWYDKFKNDAYPSDYVTLRGVKMRPPKYYDGQFEIESPKILKKLKLKRRLNAHKHVDNNTGERLHVRETCQKAKANLLKRSYEDESI